MSIYKLYVIIGPIATPAPAAIALATRLYGSQTDLLSSWSIALFGLAALEIVGALCTKDLIYCALNREWNWFKVQLLGVLLYIGLGIYALWGLTAWIYVVLAIFVHIAVARELLKNEIKTDKYVEYDTTLRLEKEKTKQANASARKAKAEQAVLLDPAPLRASNRAKPSNLERAIEYLSEHPEATERELAGFIGCSPSTAHGYFIKMKGEK